jgi:class 3 adenylate cyclase/tetratricopeptide (TPR) repeat protein
VPCDRCHNENPPHAKFCLECGAALGHRCTHCGTALPPAARFCLECGTAVGNEASAAPGETVAHAAPAGGAAPVAAPPPAPAARERERKQVTVLFADVVNFTGLAERLDPERVHGIMDRCVRLLVDEVQRYDGTVSQFTGDGIMALFGAPLAHEDAPEHAIRAALTMQAALARYREELHRTHDIDFRMRIGIHTGPVVVGSVGDDAHGDYTALGDTTNLAARLQGAAAPGAVLISEATARLVTGRFVLRARGPLALKGKSKTVTAFEVERALPRAPLLPVSKEGLTPLVGRAAELSTLETLFGHVRAGHGQLAFLVGDAGLGKSRLVHEFRKRLGTDAPTWLVGRCVSFGRGIPFLPVIDVLKAGFGIEESDDDATIIAKVHAGVGALGTAVTDTEPYVRALLAVDPGDAAVAAMDAGARRFATFDALKRLTLAIAARQPIVILVEDLHWLDQASEEFLTFVVDVIATAPILVLCTYRPPYRPPFGDRSYIARVALQPLSADEAAALATAMLHTDVVPGEIRALVAAKAEGNPFFIEEVTKSLLEIGALVRVDGGYALGRPVEEIVIPDTIQDVIMARIDRLGDGPKRAIQVASVIGREFAVRLLQRAADLGDRVETLVGELRALELIYEKSGVPELAYMFKHALTHDVAYGSLLVQRRQELHRIIGRATEELYADRLGEHLETLAYHYERAEEWPRAFDYLVKAGHKAVESFANREAIDFYRRALAVAVHVDPPPPVLREIYGGKGKAHFGVSEFPEAREAFEQALALAADDRERGHLTVLLAWAQVWCHEFDNAVTTAERALGIGERATAPLVIGAATNVLGFVHMCRGNVELGIEHYDEAARLATAAGVSRLATEARAYKALTVSWRGDYARALDELHAVVTEFTRENQMLLLAMAHSNVAVIRGGAGDYAGALTAATEGIALGEAIGDRVWRARTWNTRGWILGELGHFEAAEEANRRCLEIAAQLGGLKIVSELIGNAAANLADAAVWRGDVAGAEPHLATVAEILADRQNEWMVWRYGMHHQVAVAEHALARGDLGRARDALGTCLTTARRTNSRRYIVRATRLLAECHVAGGNLAEAEMLLAGAVTDARALANPPQLWHALAAYGRVLDQRGKSDEAAAARGEASAVVAATAQALPDDLRDRFAAAPICRALGEAGA